MLSIKYFGLMKCIVPVICGSEFPNMVMAGDPATNIEISCFINKWKVKHNLWLLGFNKRWRWLCCESSATIFAFFQYKF
jgi:hypothetical protein